MEKYSWRRPTLVTQDKSTQDNLIVKAIRHPFSVAILILSIVILIVWSDQRATSKKDMPEPTTGSAQNDIKLSPPTLANSGRDVPKIVQQMGGNTGQAGSGSAPGLESLIGGLEAKVKADPDNLGNRILLAQTYNQLGLTEKAMKELRAVQVLDPKNIQANLVLGSLLSESEKEKDLKESLSILDNIDVTDDRQKYLIEMHKGDAYSGLKQKAKALTHWKTALSLMPESDGRYAMLQKRIQSASTK